ARRDARPGPPRMIFRRLLPEPGDLGGAEAVAGLAGREVLAVNMVCSADGRAAFGGVTAPLSDPADRELFHLLRAQADAILVGTGTLRTERYGRMIKDERRRAERAAAGLAPEPIAVTLTRALDLVQALEHDSTLLLRYRVRPRG